MRIGRFIEIILLVCKQRLFQERFKAWDGGTDFRKQEICLRVRRGGAGNRGRDTGVISLAINTYHLSPICMTFIINCNKKGKYAELKNTHSYQKCFFHLVNRIKLL